MLSGVSQRMLAMLSGKNRPHRDEHFPHRIRDTWLSILKRSGPFVTGQAVVVNYG